VKLPKFAPFPVIPSLAFLAFAFVAPCLAAGERLPNVVVILTDDQGFADVGSFGGSGISTPNLDRLATEGRRFTNFHVSQAVCSASRASLLTGCYANRIGIHNALGPRAEHGLAPQEVTLAELLRDKGYATGMAGKWHLGHHRAFLPLQHGFDEFFGIPYSNDMWPGHPDQRNAKYPPLPLIEGDEAVRFVTSPQDQEELTADFTARAVAFIERNHDRPFFFYLAHPMPHVPLHVSSRFKGRSELGLYGDVLMEIDWSVGEILSALEKHGLADDTLVIFTSDNGPWLAYGSHAGSAGPLREGKGTAWEGGTRVPCIMRWPRRIPAGTVSDDMVMTIDLLPTLAGLIDAALPEHPIDGRDVWPLLSGVKGAVNPHEAYLYYHNTNELQAIVSGDGRWKLQLPHAYRSLARRMDGPVGSPAGYSRRVVKSAELYDLRADIGETTNLAAQHPDVVNRLLGLAARARMELGDTLTASAGRNVRPPGRISALASTPTPARAGASGTGIAVAEQRPDSRPASGR
jgi:arylsulfatase A